MTLLTPGNSTQFCEGLGCTSSAFHTIGIAFHKRPWWRHGPCHVPPSMKPCRNTPIIVHHARDVARRQVPWLRLQCSADDTVSAGNIGLSELGERQCASQVTANDLR